MCYAIVLIQSCHTYVCLTHICVSHTYELSCVPVTIYMLVGAHVLCYRTHLVVSHICVSHTYMCVTHIWGVICVPTIRYVMLVGASVLWYQLSHAIYIWHDFTPFPPYSTKKVLKWYRSQGGLVSNLGVIESRCRFRHSPRSHIGDVLWNSKPDSYRQFSQCFWSALLVLRKMGFDTKVLERPTQNTPRKGPLLYLYHVTKWLSVIYIHHGDMVWDGYDQ